MALPIKMSRFLPVLLPLLLGSSTFSQEIQFNRDIRPILSDKCFLCHGPDEKKRKADLRLDQREGALADLGGYAAVSPGKPDESELLARVLAHEDSSELMPPPDSNRGQLTPKEVSLLRGWIEQGAPYQGHWAFEPVAKVAIPNSWQDNPIDYFIEKRLKKAGITPSTPTDSETLLRRLSLDLTGLLPSLEEQESFPAAGLERTVAVGDALVTMMLLQRDSSAATRAARSDGSRAVVLRGALFRERRMGRTGDSRAHVEVPLRRNLVDGERLPAARRVDAGGEQPAGRLVAGARPLGERVARRLAPLRERDVDEVEDLLPELGIILILE